jgi:sugar phosphate permease
MSSNPDIQAMDAVVAAPVTAAPARPMTHRRWFMLSLLLIATIINYVDRVNISIAAPFMAKDLGLDKVEMGLIFSAFAWTYAFALVPAGFIADRFGSRFTYGASLISWSAVTVCQGMAGGFASLFGLRLAIGAMEAPAFPANSRAVTVWFPARERGMASSIYVCGQYLGTALFPVCCCGSPRPMTGATCFTAPASSASSSGLPGCTCIATR